MHSIFAFSFFVQVLISESRLICTEEFCNSFKQKNKCPDLPSKCKIQNATHNGIFLPFPDFCNCCDFCLENLDEGASCAMGDLGSIIPSSICGPGLACKDNICQRMATECMKKQDEYDERRKNGTLGALEIRSKCDRNGLFEPFKCIPGQSCFCVDEDGSRIFGEIDYNPEFSHKCSCSRKFRKAAGLISRNLRPNEFFRCTNDGNYDSLQCIGEQCFCVDVYDGAPAPDQASVNIKLISNKKLSCFDEKIHAKKFYYKCTLKHVKVLEKIAQLQQRYDFLVDFKFPDCSLDGKYAPVQQNSTHYYCVDPEGNKIENYAQQKSDNTTVDCKCARTRRIMSSTEKPECCFNGNFREMQCRRGFCRCVDSDGYQIEPELPLIEAKILNCYSKLCKYK